MSARPDDIDDMVQRAVTTLVARYRDESPLGDGYPAACGYLEAKLVAMLCGGRKERERTIEDLQKIAEGSNASR
jgi:hypothetical protein